MQIVTIIDHMIHLNFLNIIAETAIFTAISAILYLFIQKVIYRISDDKTEINYNSI